MCRAGTGLTVLLAAPLAIVAACGSTTGSGGVRDAGDAAPSTDAQIPLTPTVNAIVPPPRPSASSMESTPVDRWLVVKTLALGVTDRGTGAFDSNAWKTYGFDLDGVDTTLAGSKANEDTACSKVAGAGSAVLVDGNGGIDNNFGSQILTVLKSLSSDFEDSTNADIAAGGATFMLHLAGVGPMNDPHVPGALYVAGNFAGTPRFDGTDVWPVLATSLADGMTIGDPIARFDDGYVADGVWVSGDRAEPTTFPLRIRYLGAVMTLSLSFVLVSVSIDGSNGTLAGAMSPSTIAGGFAQSAAALGLCAGSKSFEAIVASLTEACDLSLEGPQFRSPGTPCDAISVGIGFTAAAAQPPTLVVQPQPGLSTICTGSGT